MRLCRNQAQKDRNPLFLLVFVCLSLRVAISSSRRQNLSREDSW